MRKLRCPRPMGRVFVIDVSGPSVHGGIVHEACEGIRRSLYGNGTEDEEVLGTGEKIAIVTVAETIGFWNLSVRLASFESDDSRRNPHYLSYPISTTCIARYLMAS